MADEERLFTDRSKLSVSLWTCITHIPSLFNQVERLIYDPQEVVLPLVQQLSLRVRHRREMLANWLFRFKTVLAENPDSTPLSCDRRYEILGVGMAMLVISNRLLLAVHHDMAGVLEPETQSLARQIMHLQQRASEANPRAGIFMTLKIVLAQATLATKDEWHCPPDIARRDRAGGSPRLIPPEVFAHWCQLKGRRAYSHNPGSDEKHRPRMA